MLRRRGLDFAAVTVEFLAAAAIVPSRGRLMATGMLNGRLVTVVFAPLGAEAISIVTMRAASRRERRLL